MIPARTIAQRERRRRHKNRRHRRMKTRCIWPVTEWGLQQRWDFYGGRCWICGRTADGWDHVVPLALDGLHVLANLRPACGPCNTKMGNLVKERTSTAVMRAALAVANMKFQQADPVEKKLSAPISEIWCIGGGEPGRGYRAFESAWQPRQLAQALKRIIRPPGEDDEPGKSDKDQG